MFQLFLCTTWAQGVKPKWELVPLSHLIDPKSYISNNTGWHSKASFTLQYSPDIILNSRFPLAYRLRATGLTHNCLKKTLMTVVSCEHKEFWCLLDGVPFWREALGTHEADKTNHGQEPPEMYRTHKLLSTAVCTVTVTGKRKPQICTASNCIGSRKNTACTSHCLGMDLTYAPVNTPIHSQSGS